MSTFEGNQQCTYDMFYAGKMIGHLSRMAFASSSVDRFSATQGSDELLTNHSTFEGGQSKKRVDCNTCLQAKHVDDGVQLCQPELPLLIAAPEHKLHLRTCILDTYW